MEDRVNGEAILGRLLEMKMPFEICGQTHHGSARRLSSLVFKKGFPDGELGGLMALALEIRINGLEGMLGRR